jgi:2-polyprenyl-6-methoxyphenol hydroxylase-like FAD-dependent oxidoreductase
LDVLISGGSIAGLSTARWLGRHGHDVTLLERADGLRSGGVAVDVRGAALDVVRDMGILEEISARRVPTDDVYYFLDAAGDVQATFTPSTQFYDSPEDIEISRDTLAEILLRAVPPTARLLFDTWIEEIDDSANGVYARLSDGSTRRFDLIVGADGMHSGVRQLVFGAEARFVHHLGLYVAIVKDCPTDAPVAGSHVYNEPGRMVMLRGDGRQCSAFAGFRSEWFEYDYRDLDSHKRYVRAAFADDRGWKVPAIMAEVERARDLYFDSVSQIRMERWTSGRVALVGDAGYAPSFFSGMGTSLALVGAATLAREIEAAEHDLPLALAGYDRRMRPIVDEAQGMADGGAAILFPRTAEEILARNAMVREATVG